MTKSERKRLCEVCRAKFPGKTIPLFQKELRKQRKEKQEQERLTKKGARAAVRAECVKRAGGWCECGCMRVLNLEMDHFYGRRFESVETCWMLARVCHVKKTQNDPSRRVWDAEFMRHCAKYGYPFTPRFGGRPKADAPKVPSEAISSARESR